MMTPQQPSDETKRASRGAPQGNQNALRHGLRAAELPKGCSGITRKVNDWRRALERAVIAAKGGISLVDAATIHIAMRQERHAALCERWLRVEKDLSPEIKRSFAHDIVEASERRDRCLVRLGLTLDSHHADPLASLPDIPSDNPTDLSVPQSGSRLE